jgi:hypothetical protein
MPFEARIYRVLVASPSDMPEERQVATDAINEWNSLHAAAESVVLLPVKWETHATPQTGVRPQQAINDQLVETSDILIGMFWTRIGTDTGVAESGTVEEVNQFVAGGKPAMLYFSHRPIDPNRIDLKQHKKLREFEAETLKTALVGSFTGLDDLRHALLRHLLSEVRQSAPVRRRTRHIEKKLDEAKKLNEIIHFHQQHNITPEQYDSYRELLGLKPSRKSRGESDNPVVGLFFDYGGVVSASINRDEPNEGWSCIVEIAGDNYETKKFEVICIAVALKFDTAADAILHGKQLIENFGVGCIDERIDEL